MKLRKAEARDKKHRKKRSKYVDHDDTRAHLHFNNPSKEMKKKIRKKAEKRK